jgi:hypothetical protein
MISKNWKRALAVAAVLLYVCRQGDKGGGLYVRDLSIPWSAFL